MSRLVSGFLLLGVGACATGEALEGDDSTDPFMTFDGSVDDGSLPMGPGGTYGAGGFAFGGTPPAGGTPTGTGGRAGTGGRSGGDGGTTPNTGGTTPNTGGATPNTGGTTPNTGGVVSGDGGAPPAGGASSGGAPGCSTGQKLCGGICAAPNPGNGCGPTGCTVCDPAPPNAYVVCTNQQCAFDCYVGFKLNATSDGCEPEAGGGAGGGGATGGSCPSSPAGCPSCGIGPCCNLITGRCGCNYVWCV